MDLTRTTVEKSRPAECEETTGVIRAELVGTSFLGDMRKSTAPPMSPTPPTTKPTVATVAALCASSFAGPCAACVAASGQ